MKKILAILTSVLLLVSSLACGIVLTTAEETTENTPIVFDFTTQDCFDGSMEYVNIIWGGTTAQYRYDATAGALRVDFSNAAHGHWFEIQATDVVNAIAAKEYEAADTRPVMMMKYRFAANTSGVATRPKMLSTAKYNGVTEFQPATYGTPACGAVATLNADATSSTVAYTEVGKYNFYEAQEGENPVTKGQGVYSELDANWDSVQWMGQRWRILNLSGAAKSFTMYIDCIGYFASVDEANNYQNGSVCLKPEGAKVEGSALYSLPSDLFFDLSNEANVKALVNSKDLWVYNNNADSSFTHGFDTTANAYKITYSSATKNSLQLQLGMSGKKTYSALATDYPILALKVKISNSYTAGGAWPKGPVLHNAHCGGSTNYYVPDLLASNANVATGQNAVTDATAQNPYDLDNNSDWQLMLVNMKNTQGTAKAWTQIQMYLDKVGGNTGNTGTTIWLQWAGMFASRKDAQTFFNNYTGYVAEDTQPMVFDFSTKDCYDGSMDYVNITTSSSASTAAVDYGYDATEGALHVSFDCSTDRDQFTIKGLNQAMAVAANAYENPVIAIKYRYPVAKNNLSVQPRMSFNGGDYLPCTYGQIGCGNANTTKDTSTTVAISQVGKFNFNEAQTSGLVSGQTVYPDLVNAWDTVEWQGLSWTIVSRATTGTVNDFDLYIDWIGFFASPMEARSYVDGSVCLKEPVSPPSGFLYDYSSKENFDAYVGQELPSQTEQEANTVATDRTAEGFNGEIPDVKYTHKTFAYDWGRNAGGNSVLSYDSAKKAMKIVAEENYLGAADPNVDHSNNMVSAYQPGKIAILPDYSTTKVSMKDYPIFAVKVKLADASYTFDAASTSISTRSSDAGGFASNYTTSEGYNGTTGWQLLIVNINHTADYRAVMLSLLPKNTPVDAGQEIGWIEWAGAFKKAEDAQAYFDKTTTEPELYAEGLKIGLTGKSLRFGFEMEIDGVTYGEGFNRSMRDDAAMTVAGEKRVVKDFGVVLTTIDKYTDADLSLGATGASKVVPADKLYEVNGTTIQFVATLYNIPKEHYGRVVSARAYVTYEDGTTVYSDVIRNSVNNAYGDNQ